MRPSHAPARRGCALALTQRGVGARLVWGNVDARIGEPGAVLTPATAGLVLSNRAMSLFCSHTAWPVTPEVSSFL